MGISKESFNWADASVVMLVTILVAFKRLMGGTLCGWH